MIEKGRPLARSITVDGSERRYILDVPESIRPGKPAALLLDFHGFGHNAAGVWRVSAFKDLAEREGFITVYPDGLPVHLLGRDAPGWDIFRIEGNGDLLFVRRLLDHLAAAYCIDESRVFATGFSNGAFLSHLLACTMAERFAAVAPVSGGAIALRCEPRRPVPVMIHHGRLDELIPPERARQARDRWIAMNGCEKKPADGCEHYQCREGSEVVYCEADFAHSWPAEATARIWEFFRRHPLPAR